MDKKLSTSQLYNRIPVLKKEKTIQSLLLKIFIQKLDFQVLKIQTIFKKLKYHFNLNP